MPESTHNQDASSYRKYSDERFKSSLANLPIPHMVNRLLPALFQPAKHRRVFQRL
jgi:hypothetical protein